MHSIAGSSLEGDIRGSSNYLKVCQHGLLSYPRTIEYVPLAYLHAFWACPHTLCAPAPRQQASCHALLGNMTAD